MKEFLERYQRFIRHHIWIPFGLFALANIWFKFVVPCIGQTFDPDIWSAILAEKSIYFDMILAGAGLGGCLVTLGFIALGDMILSLIIPFCPVLDAWLVRKFFKKSESE